MTQKNLAHLFIIAILISAPAQAMKKQPVTLEQIVEMRSVANVKVSPDGQWLAYMQLVPRDVFIEDDGLPYVELHVSDFKGNSRGFISGKQRLGSISWGANSKHIYFIAQRNEDSFASIYRIAIDGGEPEKVVGAQSDISAYTVNHQGDGLTYITKQAVSKSKQLLISKGFNSKVYEESEKKSEAFFVFMREPGSAHIKLNIDQHILTVDYHPTSNKLLVRVAPTALIDDKYVNSRYIITEQYGSISSTFKTVGKLGKAQWSADGKYVAIIGATSKNDPSSSGLYLGNSKSGEVTELTPNYQGHIRDIQWLSKYQIAFLGHIGTKSEVSIVNVDSGKISNRIPPGNEVINTIHADSSGKYLAGIASSNAHPREVVSLTENKIERLTDLNHWLKSVQIPQQKTIQYKTRDGLELQGVLVYPIGYSKRKKYPLIMMIHGGPENHVSDGWLDKYSYPVKYAAANGFVVFLPNYRGSTGRGVEFSKLGQADYAGAEFNDLVDAITHLSEIGLIDKNKVGITGGSYGGYAAAWAATALSEHFAASVMFMGSSNQLSKFGTTEIPKEIYNVHARKYPWDDWQWMLERSPIFHTDKAKTPILIMHGEKDTRVHPAQSMELYRYIKTRTDTPVRLVYYPDEPHGNKKGASQLDYSIRLMRWMEFYLKGENKGQQIPPYELELSEYLLK